MWKIFLILIIACLLMGNTTEGLRIKPTYDIRGDPYIPFTPVSPWMNPGSFPYRNRPLSDLE